MTDFAGAYDRKKLKFVGNIKKYFSLYKKINLIQQSTGTRKYPWVSKYPWITYIEIPARVRGRVQVPYLSIGVGTDIILPVPMDIH